MDDTLEEFSLREYELKAEGEKEAVDSIFQSMRSLPRKQDDLIKANLYLP